MRSTIKSAKTVDEAIELGLKDLGLSRDEIEYEILEDAKSGFLGIFGSKDAIVRISEKEEFKIDINDIYGKKALREERLKKEEAERKKREEKEAQEKKEAARRLEAEKKAEAERLLLEEKRAKEELQKKAEKEKEVIEEDKDEKLNSVKKELEDLLHMMHIDASVEAKAEPRALSFNLVDISEENTGIIIGRKGETLDSLQYILSLMANRNSSEFIRVTLNVANYRNRRKESIENNARKVAFKVIKSKKSIALDPMNSYERRIVHYALQKYKEVETVSQGSFPNRKVIIKYKDK